jgi:hypothetical protein
VNRFICAEWKCGTGRPEWGFGDLSAGMFLQIGRAHGAEKSIRDRRYMYFPEHPRVPISFHV